ncbi:neurexin protein binding [Homalodisca vitripennis]|nr:neurexin protein binding [Homalodisca vitripennis]
MAVSCPGSRVLQLTERREISGRYGVTGDWKLEKASVVISNKETKDSRFINGLNQFEQNGVIKGQENSNIKENVCKRTSKKCVKYEKNRKTLLDTRRKKEKTEDLATKRNYKNVSREDQRRSRTPGNSKEKKSSRRYRFLPSTDTEVRNRECHKGLNKSSIGEEKKRSSQKSLRTHIFLRDVHLSTTKNYYQRLGYFWVGMLWAVTFSEFCVALTSSRTVRTKYGDLSGVIVTPDNRYLDAVEVFKGVPYASPPVGSLRFMPPVTGAMWTGVRMANRFSPVCPQRLPDLKNETAALKRMPRGRLEHLKRILPYLNNQSEDCLYLNIYVPAHADLRDNPTMFPVLVYIHGESYMWGAGSLYDGTVLSSYGGLVVVTVNYRLGVLGFLNANADPHQHSPSNFGLMDQIAALHWIQENIAQFGGDPRNVTLMGHGTGAACVHFLMTSTAVPDGMLFQRAILMSGSALCPWALVREPARYTRQVARHVGCPADIQLLQCLRERPLELILSAPVESPEFLTAFGPSVDGVVIGGRSLSDDIDDLHVMPPGSGPIHFHNFLNLNNPTFRKSMVAKMSRYDLLIGMVRLEAYFSFTAEDVQYGIESDRKARIMRTFVKNTYRYHLSEILATVVNEYTDWERPVQHPSNIRDETMDALSDALVVAPLVHTADLHSPTRTAGSYMYVFDYQTRLGDYPQKQGCIHGEELPYVFGAPLVSSMMHFPRNFTKTEIQLSEATLDYWTNFVKTGNPNQGTDIDLPLGIRLERQKIKNIDWVTYDRIHKRYLLLDMKPKMKSHYRAHRLSFWLHLVPDLHHPGGEDVPRSHHQLDNDDSPHQESEVKPPKKAYSPPPKQLQEIKPLKNSSHDNPPMVIVASSKGSPRRQREDGFAAYSTTLTITLTVGCSLLFLNIVAFLMVFYRQNRDRRKTPRHSSRVTSENVEKKLENGGPMATICVTSGATECSLSTVETILTPTPTPILRGSGRDLRLLVLQAPQDISPPCELQEPLDVRPPLPPKTSKLTQQVPTETQPLLLASTHLISGSHGTLTRIKEEDVLRV